MPICRHGPFTYCPCRKVNKSVPEKQAWQWLVQLLLSLSYIHSKRILHRLVQYAFSNIKL